MTIRFGVIGLRRGQSFVRVCKAAKGAEVVSLYDIDVEKVASTAAEIGAQPFTDYDAFLDSGIDAVVVASPLPYHARQAVAALNAGVHVLSEVTACSTMDDARALVMAQRGSKAMYMMAENYRYMDEVELLKCLNDDKRFGDVYYLEGEYLHDCRDLWFDENGELTWRGRGLLGVYCTHSLGPLLYITGERVVSVSAMSVPGGKFNPVSQTPTMYTMQMVTDAGTVLKVRVDHTSPRPHQMHYYQVQGTRGSFESWRGHGDTSKIWLEDIHGDSRASGHGAEWHSTEEQALQYIPDRLNVPEEAKLGGHGTSEYWLLKDFMAAIRDEIAPPIDVYRALDYTIPGILAVESAKTFGTPIEVPDPRLLA